MAVGHFGQVGCIQSGPDLGIDHLRCRQDGHPGQFHAQRLGHEDRIAHDIHLLLQPGSHNHATVADEEQPVVARQLDNGDMR